MEAQRSFAFGPFVFHPLSRRLEQNGELVLLSSRAAELLLILLKRAGQLVTKDELQFAGWGNRAVAENNLTVHMAALRRVLRDGGEGEGHIRTEHGRGYRFITPVARLPAERDSLARASDVRTGPGPEMRRISILVSPVETPPNDVEARSIAVEVGQHIMVQLSRIHDGLVAGVPAGELNLDMASLSQLAPQERKARYTLRTSVRSKGSAVQVFCMVDDSSGGTTIWADRFEHQHIGLCSVENEIAGRLVHGVVTELVDREAAEGPPEDALLTTGAPYCALRGWSALNRGLMFPEDLAEARRWFDRALLIDQSLATALAGCAYAIVTENLRITTRLRSSLADNATRTELRQADAMATRAVARAPDWPKAWFCRGYVRYWQRRFEEALAAFERTLSLDPCDAEAHACAGHVAFLAGDLEAMPVAVRHAIALSPRHRGAGLWHQWLGIYDFWHERDELAIPHFLRAMDLAPSLVYPVSFLAGALAHAGRITEGRNALDAWCDAMGNFRLTIDHLRAQVLSDHPNYLAGHQRLYRGLRLLGVPER